MSNVSDAIERLIKQRLRENDGEAVIARNELASRLNVVPSQITYVLSTRFTTLHGYVIESRRGGGGRIVVRRAAPGTANGYRMHAANAIGESLSLSQARILIQNFLDYEAVTERTALLMLAAVGQRTLSGLSVREADRLRAALLKNMLTALAVLPEDEIHDL